LEAAGIHDVLTKSIGTNNKHNVVHATVAALKSLRSAEGVARSREKELAAVAYDYPVAATSGVASSGQSIIVGTVSRASTALGRA
jgi:hypothetical protein